MIMKKGQLCQKPHKSKYQPMTSEFPHGCCGLCGLNCGGPKFNLDQQLHDAKSATTAAVSGFESLFLSLRK